MAEGLNAAASKVLVIATGLVAMAGESAGSTPLEEDIHAAYVLFASAPDDGATPLPFARLIIEPDRDCPLLVFEDGPVAMTERRNPDVKTGRNDFPVKVCEAQYVLDQTVRVLGTGIMLPRVGLDPTSLIVFGVRLGQFLAFTWPIIPIFHHDSDRQKWQNIGKMLGNVSGRLPSAK